MLSRSAVLHLAFSPILTLTALGCGAASGADEPGAEVSEISSAVTTPLITSATTANLFATLNGLTTTAISSKINTEWATYKSQRIRYLGTKAYVSDGGSPAKVLTEGMGYGMMLAVQMNDQTLFDQLYAFVQAYMLITDTSGSLAYANGYHRWKINADGTPDSTANSVAPDGEEWIAASLSVAKRRWASGTYNYGTEASTLWHRLEYPVNAFGGFCIDPTSTNAGYHVVRFGPYNTFTDPSYILPGFYALAADTLSGTDATDYADIYSKGHAFLQNTPANPSNTSQNWGLHPDYANWDGSPRQANTSDAYGPVFSFDAFRTTMNMAMDLGWTGNGSGYYWQVASRRQDQFYYYGSTVGATVGLGVGGFSYGQLVSSSKPVALVAANATASALYTWANTERASFTNALWTTYHPSDYYGDNLYMVGLLMAGGQFRNSF